MGALVVAASLLAGTAPADAALARYRTTRQLAGSASSVFRGVVLDRVAHWQGEWIVTDVLVAVDECWAGPCDESTAVVRELGGEVDGIGMLPPEPTALPIGEEVVIFGRSRGAVLEAVGGMQGVFRLDRSNDLAERSLASVVDRPTAAERPITIASLRREVVRAFARVEEGR